MFRGREEELIKRRVPVESQARAGPSESLNKSRKGWAALVSVRH